MYAPSKLSVYLARRPTCKNLIMNLEPLIFCGPPPTSASHSTWRTRGKSTFPPAIRFAQRCGAGCRCIIGVPANERLSGRPDGRRAAATTRHPPDLRPPPSGRFAPARRNAINNSPGAAGSVLCRPYPTDPVNRRSERVRGSASSRLPTDGEGLKVYRGVM